MLVELLVIWLVVVPVLTVLGTYVISGIMARRGAIQHAEILTASARHAHRHRLAARIERNRSHLPRPGTLVRH